MTAATPWTLASEAGATAPHPGRAARPEPGRGLGLARGLRIPLWGEGRGVLELVGLLRDPVFRGEGVAHGAGRGVLLVPGFAAGDASLGLMSAWLRRCGYHPFGAGVVANVDCGERAVVRLEARAAAVRAATGRRVAVVGHSRGGSLARVLARRRPDLVETAVTLGSPLRDALAVHPLVRGSVWTVALLGSLGVPGMFRRSCRDGACCRQFRSDLAAPLDPDLTLVTVWSRSDGIVDWRACVQPGAMSIEVESSHCGMAANAGVYRALASALAAAATPSPAGRR